jgi:hypothetical protein
MEIKRKVSTKKREEILKILKQSAQNYKETNHILDMILPEIPSDKSIKHS